MNFFKKLKSTESRSICPENFSLPIHSCTPCCPFDNKNLIHPRFSPSFLDQTRFFTGSDRLQTTEHCCLSKLRVNCRIECQDKRKKYSRKTEFNPIRPSFNPKRVWSNSSEIDRSRKRNRTNSPSNTNNLRNDLEDYKSNSDSSLSSSIPFEIDDDSSLKPNDSSISTSIVQMKNLPRKDLTKNTNYRVNRSICDVSSSNSSIHRKIDQLKMSIDQLAQVVNYQSTPSTIKALSVAQTISWLDRIRNFFGFLTTRTSDTAGDEWFPLLLGQKISTNHLIEIYRLLNYNDNAFTSWLRTILPEHLHPIVLNYVKHLSSASSEDK